MIRRNRENFILNKAKNAGDALASASIFNDVQDKIFRLQPIDEFLNNFIMNKTSKKSLQDFKNRKLKDLVLKRLKGGDVGGGLGFDLALLKYS